MVWMGKQTKNILENNQSGQSTVEYILLMLVVTFLGFSVIKSDRFQKFFGKDSTFFKKIALQMQYSYRHGRLGSEEEIESDDTSFNGGHDTYRINGASESRFFMQTSKYPGP